MENVAAPVAAPKQKNPLLAAIGSFFIPGLGQVYNGEGFVKGLLYLIGTLIGYIILFIPGFAIWLFGIYKAYKVAKDMNAGIVPFKETTTINLAIYIVIALIIYGIYVVAIIIFSAIIAAFVFGMVGGTTSYNYNY
jgi:TM2 domain-containing membrane protein YozV